MNAPADKCVLRGPKIFFIPHKTRYVEHNLYSLEARKTGWLLICSRSEYLPISLAWCLFKECCIGKRWSKSTNLNKTKGHLNSEGKKGYACPRWVLNYPVKCKKHNYWSGDWNSHDDCLPTHVCNYRLVQNTTNTLLALTQIYHSHTLCLALVSWHCMPDDTPHNNVSQLGMLSLGCPRESHTSSGLYKDLIARLDMLWPPLQSNMISPTRTEWNVYY